MVLAALLALAALPAAADPSSASADWQSFERRVRDGSLHAPEGAREIPRWHGLLVRVYPAEGFGGRVFFPLSGYGMSAVGGKNGEGYKPAGYEFLGGNRHRGHPAQDIFVHDRNRDGVDDRTGLPFEVLAMADGVVLSTFTEWSADGPHRHVRGGNYVWVYHPGLGLFAYYAHLREVEVGVGDVVVGGARIATLGRTGVNAAPARSPTHLHLMLLRARDMTPVDPYPMWRQHR